MGTWNWLVIYHEGKVVLCTNGTFDGDQEWVGRRMFNFVKNVDNLNYIKRGCNYLRPATKEEESFSEEWRNYKRFADLEWHEMSAMIPYPGLKCAHADKLLPVLAGVGGLDEQNESKVEEERVEIRRNPIGAEYFEVNEEMFETDDVFYYLVDFDRDTFEVYSSYHRGKEVVPNRLQDYGDKYNTGAARCEYVFPLFNLASYDEEFPKAKYNKNFDHLEDDLKHFKNES